MTQFILQTIREWTTPTIAVLGLGLGVWNRIDKWREDRKKSAEELPWASVSFLGVEQVESPTHSVRVPAVEFRNMTRHRWIADRLELLAPATARIRKRGADHPWERVISLEWTVLAIVDQAEGRSNGHVEMRFDRMPVTDQVGPPREIAVRISAREVTAKARRRTFEARTTHRF